MAAPKPPNNALTKRLVLKIIGKSRPTKGPILAALNDSLEVNLIRLIEGKNSFIALCHSEDDALKMNTEDGAKLLNKLGLTIANTLAFEARKAIVARNFDFYITDHSTDAILKDFNKRYPENPCNKVIIMGKNKNLMKIIFNNQQDAKHFADNGFSLFHVRIPPYNIQVDEFIDVPMCMKCYQLNNHTTKQCKSSDIVCSECSEVGHRHFDCKSSIKKCINCGGNHKTTAPQCPKRKQEAHNMRQKSSQIREGTTYSAAAKSTATINPIINNSPISESIIKITAAMIYAHNVNSVNPGSFNIEINKVFAMNNLPQMKFPDNPPSEDILTKIVQRQQPNQMETQDTCNSDNDHSPIRKRKKRDPRNQLTSDELGLNIYIDPSIEYNQPRTAIKKLPKTRYKFTYTNENYTKEEIKELLENSQILIQPDRIIIILTREQYKDLPTAQLIHIQ